MTDVEGGGEAVCEIAALQPQKVAEAASHLRVLQQSQLADSEVCRVACDRLRSRHDQPEAAFKQSSEMLRRSPLKETFTGIAE